MYIKMIHASGIALGNKNEMESRRAFRCRHFIPVQHCCRPQEGHSGADISCQHNTVVGLKKGILVPLFHASTSLVEASRRAFAY